MVLDRILDEEMLIRKLLRFIDFWFGDSPEALDNFPERGTAIIGIQEVRRFTTRRKAVDPICVDVSLLEGQLPLESHVEDFIPACNQPMDKNITTAVCLALHATGKCYRSENDSTTSSTRILFSGLGAVELKGK